MKKIIGALIIFFVFAIIIGIVAREHGLINTLVGFGATAVLSALVIFGAYLLTD